MDLSAAVGLAEQPKLGTSWELIFLSIYGNIRLSTSTCHDGGPPEIIIVTAHAQ